MHQDTSSIEMFFDYLKNHPCTGWIAPQFIHIPQVLKLAGKSIKVGAQNCSHQIQGALTGEVSPMALKDMGVDFVLIGHSERRTLFGEDDRLLNEKLLLAQKCGLRVVFCVGETLEERESGKTKDVLSVQLEKGLKGWPGKDLLIAYEPVWAIGTGKTATPQQAEEIHRFIKEYMAKSHKVVPVLYGGSVKPDNVKELLAQKNIDGGLVGGASLRGEDFTALCLQ